MSTKFENITRDKIINYKSSKIRNKRFWNIKRIMRRIRNLKTNSNEQFKFNPTDKEMWAEHYKKFLTEHLREEIYITRESTQLGSISMEDIKKAQRGMKNNLSLGPGDILVKLIKYAPHVFIELLISFFSLCVKTVEITKSGNKPS